ncbi:NAD(P)/FAD-dependent oxidoreductase [Nitrospirillum sp. BR 11163]|uniref:phytoene desaturase family protein n=1 Tax=Nitrospirillum sp. BR 11163 TaxID=3104323 RepID=UPI002AFFEC6E|nr:NAD(P)/FAD-dependent oxidoreductase [Nitrospirillum sp. BR 11163]MEA1672129.1 NAD(P)/FAD-dependent oxidoreductase [Nitrospirillum sp. BR 11163]
MSDKYDVVVMGAGHNGLVAAAYLAKAGKKVLVVERQAWPGGGVVTRELNTPGYRHDLHSSVHIMIQGNPMITQDELGLFARFGLKYNYSDVPYASIFADQSFLITYKDLDRACAEIAKFSAKDADTYRVFAQRSMEMLPMFVSGLYAPPLPMGAFIAMLDQSEEGREMLDAMSRSSVDIIDNLFEHPRVKMHLLKLVTENLQMPDELGTGMGIYLMPGIIHTYGVSQPVGGSGGLTDALVRCVEHYGGEIRLNAEVGKVIISGGRATGLMLADGEVVSGKDGVIAAIHPHRIRTFLGAAVEEKVVRRAERVNTSTFSLFVSHYDLKKRATFYAGPEVATATMLEYYTFDSLPEMLDDFDCLRRGRLPKRPLTGGSDETHADPTRAPPGAGIWHAITMAPYRLEEGGAARWDEIKEEVADHNLSFYRKFTPSLTDDNIIARTTWSPLDMERSSPNSFVNGDMHGAAPFMYQTMAHRPTPDLGNLTVPGVNGLYLVGPFMHPGGGVYGAGRATAIKMFDDLGIDFDRAVGA